MQPRLRFARRETLWYLAALLAVQLGLGAALEGPLVFLRNPNYAAKLAGLNDLLRQHPDRPLVLALGTSRTLYGLRPDLLVRTGPEGRREPLLYNFGAAGCGLLEQYLYLMALKRNGICPEAVIVEVVPALLVPEPQIATEGHALRHSWHDLEVVAPFLARPKAFHSAWWSARLMPAFAYRFNVSNCCCETWLPWFQRESSWKGIDRWGWGRIPERHRPARNANGARAQYQPLVRAARIDPANERAVRVLLAECRDRATPVVVVLMPEGAEFRSWYAPEFRRLVDRFLADLRREFRVPVVDAREWVEREESFTDGHHLLPEGAEQFTRRFEREVLPLFRRPVGVAAADSK